MNEQKQNPENSSANLATGQTVAADSTNPCREACDEILNKIKGCGIPVTVNFAPVEPGCESQFVELNSITKFIEETRIDFNCYKKVMDNILNEVYKAGYTADNKSSLGDLCKEEDPLKQISPFKEDIENGIKGFRNNGPLISTSKAYNILKFITEQYVNKILGIDPGDIPPIDVLPYIKLIEAKLSDVCCKCEIKFRPMFAELIWNYWHEEGMMVHTINAIAKRFQNKRSNVGMDPLSNLAIDPLRPLNNLIWGYIQDSINRLTQSRRAFEYDHEYGLSLFAAGGSKLNTADSRYSFIPAFHTLLYKCSLFYKEADDRFKVADAFPVLNALREVHLLLAEGAGNQFGDLPFTARVEMIIEQYILARPEVREFLGGRITVPYDEAWMDRVDTMKSLQKWPGASISYFRDLAVFGEEIILSIRWISWSQVNNRDFASAWALSFRNEIQRYTHCYQAVTGVDLSALEVTRGVDEKAIMPAFLMQRKLQRDALVRRR
jgi:hypothetical protein